VAHADEGIRHGDAGDGCRIRHGCPGLHVGSVGDRPGQGVEDEPGRLNTQAVGVRGSEDRHRGFHGVGKGVDTSVGGDRWSSELGVQLLFIDEDYGGMGGGTFDIYRVCERMAHIDVGVALPAG
jgi:hypothetical protein